MTEQQKNEWIEKRWGLACANWESCEKIGICRELCPNGGVDEDAPDGKEEPEAPTEPELDAEKIKAHLLCGTSDMEYCETRCFVGKGCIFLDAYRLIEKQKAEIERMKAWKPIPSIADTPIYDLLLKGGDGD